jgi:hypothetical protein
LANNLSVQFFFGQLVHAGQLLAAVGAAVLRLEFLNLLRNLDGGKSILDFFKILRQIYLSTMIRIMGIL